MLKSGLQLHFPGKSIVEIVRLPSDICAVFCAPLKEAHLRPQIFCFLLPFFIQSSKSNVEKKPKKCLRIDVKIGREKSIIEE